VKAALERLLAGEIPYVLAGPERLPSSPVLLSGSFNPLHKGHVQLLSAAVQVTGRTGLLELSLTNVDKPSPGLDEIDRRLHALGKQFGVVLTCAPTFAEKAEVLPGAWFAMGYDTAIRLLDPTYHDDIPAMLSRFAELQTRFIVAGRLHKGTYQSLDHLAIPPGLPDLFVPIPQTLFREDISSTELRGKEI
jgi:hypothetical protein